MSTHLLPLENILAPAEYEAIERSCAGLAGSDALPRLRGFLADRFGIELSLDPDVIGGFATDSSNLPGRAEALCRPRTERECAAALCACRASGTPVTISGGKSNLTGSATPRSGVILSTVNMLAPAPMVDDAAQTVRAPVGMILEDLRKAVLEQSHGRLIFPVDPTSRTDAQVGGAISCNASGFTPGDVGAMRHWTAALDVVLPNGRAVRASRGQYASRDGLFELQPPDAPAILLPIPRYKRPAIKNAGGPYSSEDGTIDAVDLFVGSEGLFGLITGCTLRLLPRPKAYLDLFFSLPEEGLAVALREHLAASLPGGVGSLTALEYFGRNCRRYMDHEERLFHGAHPVGVYIQVPLAEQSMDDAAEQWLLMLAEADCGIDEDAVLLIDNDRDRRMFLEARHSMPANSLEVVQRRGTYTIMTDTVVPPESFPEFLRFTHELLDGEGLDYLAFGHLGDCHLHFMILPARDQLERGARAYDRIVDCSAGLGGVYSGEHGTGKRKRRDFLRCYGQDAAEQVLRCKAALDPRHTLNRGNVVEV